MSNFNSQKIIAPIMRFVNMKGIIALKDGMLAILPLTVVGSLFLIIGQLPLKGLIKPLLVCLGIIGSNLLCRCILEHSLSWG